MHTVTLVALCLLVGYSVGGPHGGKPKIEHEAKRGEGHSRNDNGNGGNSGAGGGAFCFSRDQEVQTRTGAKTMDQLETGDEVLVWSSSGLVFEPVLYFHHKVASASSPYLRLKTDSGASLTLSDNHLLHVHKGKCDGTPVNEKYSLREDADQFLMAKHLLKYKLCISHVTEQGIRAEQVTGVKRIQAAGLFAPVTASGTIIVNGVVASCFTNFDDQHFLTRFHGMINSLLGSYHSIVESVESLAPEGWKAPSALRLAGTLGDILLPKFAY